MTKIKICGIRREEDIEIVNRLLPDFIGFVFAKSKRQVTFELAKELKRHLNPSIKAVGVFVNEDMEFIVKLCDAGVIDMVQLHGDESQDYIEMLHNRLPEHPVIKAIRVKDARDTEEAEEIRADYLLLDTFQEKEYGGSGKTFDWSITGRVKRNYFLAGGINAENVLQAVEKCHPYAIDVSSGVETKGWKDAVKIKEIITKVRSVK